jgi:hypothetical protein
VEVVIVTLLFLLSSFDSAKENINSSGTSHLERNFDTIQERYIRFLLISSTMSEFIQQNPAFSLPVAILRMAQQNK